MKLTHRLHRPQVDTLARGVIASTEMNYLKSSGHTQQLPRNIGTAIRREESYRIRWQAALLFLVFPVFFSCGKPFDVKPKTKVESALPTNYTATAASGDLSVSAESLTDEDSLYNTFDSNLILAGILPVRVKLTNSGNENIVLKDAKFE